MVYICARDAQVAERAAHRRGLDRTQWCYVWSPHILVKAEGKVWKVGGWDAHWDQRDLRATNMAIRSNRMEVELLDE